MRPLQAHCHRGLGTLYAKIGQQEQARAELSTAIELYRAMDMTFWLPAGGGGAGAGGGAVMDYDAVLDQVIALLQARTALSYRVLKLRLQLDDDTLEALKEDLIYAKHLAVDEDGQVLVWTGRSSAARPDQPRCQHRSRRTHSHTSRTSRP